jgi:hypothetical protein
VWDAPEDGASEAAVSLTTLLQLGDLDGLVREADRLATLGRFEDLLVLRDRCHAAAEEVGKQLWGPAQYAEYRIALHAPGPLAARVVAPGAARFALGPLTEVLAQDHRFAEVADHLDAVSAAVVAQERALRGEDLHGHPLAGEEDSGVPARLQPWEPAYALPTYEVARRSDGTPSVPLEAGVPVRGAPGRPADHPAVTRALAELAGPWEQQSEGEVHVIAVEGDAAAAVAAVLDVPAVLQRTTLAGAFAAMAWAAASGGAHGRRRGGAAGRAAAWWVGHAVTGLGFPADPDELEFHLEDLRWFLVELDDASDAPAVGTATTGEPGSRTTGWHLRLAVADPVAGWAACVDASDHAPADDEEERGV